ncbi:MAG: peptidase M48 [Planctomycetota bacterium]|nr:MAG: peptidase M48 [Planctomycetota bacterium]
MQLRLRRFLRLAPLILALLSACDSVPITGRSRFRAAVSIDQEIALGLDAYPKITGEHKEITHGPQFDMVQRVMKRIVPFASPLVQQYHGKNFAWECKLLDAKIVNAWCLPGGKMAFYTGILPICQDEAGIAVVMSHEIAHAIASHSAERMSTTMLVKAGLAGTSLALGDKPEDQARNELILGALGLGAQFGLMLPYSRKHESEADEIGLHLLVQAGYDPYAAVRLWDRMAKLGSGGPEWMSTHPASKNRSRRLAELIPSVLKKYGKSRPKP